MKRPLLALASSLVANALLAAGLTPFDNALETILANDPQIKSARLNATAEEKSAATEANLSDPELEGEYIFSPKGTPNRWSVGISQSFDWPGVYSARKRAASASATAFHYLADATEFDHRSQISSLLIDYIHSTKAIEALNEVRKATQELKSAVDTGVNGGELTRLDQNKLIIELARLDARLSALYGERDATIASLAELNGSDNLGNILGQLTEYPPYTIAEVDHYLGNLSRNPSVKAASARAEADMLGRKVADFERYPGFSIGYTHNYEDYMHFNGITVGLTLPVFSTRGKIAAADAAIEASRSEVVSVVATRRAAIISNHKIARQLAGELTTLAPLFETTSSTALLLKAYKGGQMNVMDYITELNYFLDARLDYLDILHRYNSALNSLEQYN